MDDCYKLKNIFAKNGVFYTNYCQFVKKNVNSIVFHENANLLPKIVISDNFGPISTSADGRRWFLSSSLTVV
jgi:hypothetical protein